MAGSPAETWDLRFVEMQEGAAFIDRTLGRNDVRDCRRGRDTAMVVGLVGRGITPRGTGGALEVP